MNFKRTLLGCAILLVTASSAYADGPTGFGPIKIGMTKDEVESLSSKDKYFLSTPFSSTKTIGKGRPSKDYFDSTISGPDIREPIQTTLGFSKNKLTYIIMIFPENNWLFGRLKNQVTKKYQAPKSFGFIDEKQCTLKNGRKLVIGTGIESDLWRAEMPDNPSKIIQTSFKNIDFVGCSSASIEDRAHLKYQQIEIIVIDKPAPQTEFIYKSGFEIDHAL